MFQKPGNQTGTTAGLLVYLAGPMTGYPNYNRTGFAAAERGVLARGWQVRSPQNTDPGHDGPCPAGEHHSTEAGSHPYPCWVRASLLMMLDCDAVVLLPGWQDSRGARLEKQVADTCGMPVTELAALDDPHSSVRRWAGMRTAAAVAEPASEPTTDPSRPVPGQNTAGPR